LIIDARMRQCKAEANGGAAMKACFLTSGFPNGFTDEFIHELKNYLSPINRLAFVASDFSAHEKTMKYKNIFVQWFADCGIAFESVIVVDNCITPEEAVYAIQTSNVVWLSGGPTLTQIEDINRYGLIPSLCERSGVTIGMSAGSINMAKRVVLAKDLSDGIPELSVYDGIGLVDINIEPHINSASDMHLSDVAAAAKVSPIIGLPDGSFILDVDGSSSIFGEHHLYQ